MITRIVALLTMLAPVWLYANDTNDGKLYKEALVQAIKSSNRIVVTEHSDRDDFPREEINRKDLPEYEYGKVELSAAAKAKFLQNVEAMDPTTQDVFAACIFVPHHTVMFYSGTTLQSTMRICFHCGDIYWDGSKHTLPKGLWSAISPLIKDAGFQGERDEKDWRALLNERRKELGNRPPQQP